MTSVEVEAVEEEPSAGSVMAEVSSDFRLFLEEEDVDEDSRRLDLSLLLDLSFDMMGVRDDHTVRRDMEKSAVRVKKEG